MIIRANEAKTNKIEKPRGGAGIMNALEYLGNTAIKSKLSGFNIMVLGVNSEIGYHQHVDNEEVYFILSGQAIVKDDGNEYEVGEGDLIFTGDGSFHGLKNIGDVPVKFAAFIVGI